MLTPFRPTLLFFGAGGVALGVVGNAVTYFMLIYYNQVLGLPAYLVSAALAIALVFDAMSDPLVGMLSDRTRTSLGRRHPYLYFSVLPLPLLYWLLWNPPAWAVTSESIGLAYLTVLLILFRTVMTCYAIPSNAMVPELTRDYDQRTSLMSARISTAWVAGVSFTILMYGYFLQPTPEQQDGALNRVGYELASNLGAVLILLSVLATTVGTHRHVPVLREPRHNQMLTFASMWATLKELFSNQPFRTIMGFAVVIRSADGLMAALWIYLVTFFWLLSTDQIAFLSVMNLAGSAAAMFLLPRLARLTDKRTLALICNCAAVVTTCLPILLRLAGWLPDDMIWPALVTAAFFDLCFWVMLASLIASMLTDVVEDVQASGGLRHEGAVIAYQTFVDKLSTAAGTWFAGMVLLLIAFPRASSVAEVAEATRSDLALTYVTVMLFSIALCAFILLRFTLDRTRHNQNLAALDNRV